jgi:hypothetical protein
VPLKLRHKRERWQQQAAQQNMEAAGQPAALMMLDQ